MLPRITAKIIHKSSYSNIESNYQRCFIKLKPRCEYMGKMIENYPSNRNLIVDELRVALSMLHFHDCGNSINMKNIEEDFEIISAKTILKSLKNYDEYEYDALLIKFYLHECVKHTHPILSMGKNVEKLFDYFGKTNIQDELNKINQHLDYATTSLYK